MALSDVTTAHNLETGVMYLIRNEDVSYVQAGENAFIVLRSGYVVTHVDPTVARALIGSMKSGGITKELTIE